MVPPGEKPCEVTLLDDPVFLSLAVSIGALEEYSDSWLSLEGDVGIIYNEDGHLWDLKGNRRVGEKILAGNFYIVGCKDGELISLTEKQMEHYFARLFIPEEISDAYNERILDVPSDDGKGTCVLIWRLRINARKRLLRRAFCSSCVSAGYETASAQPERKNRNRG